MLTFPQKNSNAAPFRNTGFTQYTSMSRLLSNDGKNLHKYQGLQGPLNNVDMDVDPPAGLAPMSRQDRIMETTLTESSSSPRFTYSVLGIDEWCSGIEPSTLQA
jgi:hypothetical protein